MSELGGMRVARDLNDALISADEVEEIRLSGQGLSELVEEMPFMPHLKVLDLSDNHLRTLPGWIWNQSNLEQFSFKGNEVDLIPSSISQLSKLRRIVADRNPIRGFPKLPLRIREVFANHCDMHYFPDELLDCPELQVLELSDCRMAFAEVERSLPMSLLTLDLSKNQLLKFPFDLIRTAGLEVLRIEENPFLKYFSKEIDGKWLTRFFSETYQQGWQFDQRNCALDVSLENMEGIDGWIDEQMLEVATCSFGYVRERAMDSLPKFLENPFSSASSFSLEIAGKLESLRLVDLKPVLEGKGCRIVDKAAGPEGILMIGLGAKENRWRDALASGCKIGFEKHLDAWMKANQGLSLTDAPLDHPLLANLSRLLASDDVINVEMALQIMRGTGVPKALKGTLIAMMALHPDEEIRKKVEPAFIEVADAPLRKVVARSIREAFDHNEILYFRQVVDRLADRPEVDLFALLKMSVKKHKYGIQHVSQLKPNEQAELLGMYAVAGGLGFVGVGFDEVPEGLWSHPQITWLNFKSNNLTHLDGRIGAFQSLNWLDLSNNLLKKLPDELFTLKGMSSLDLSNNRLGNIEHPWEQMESLTALKLSHNPVKKLPESLGKMAALELLGLEGLKSHVVLDGLQHLSNLKDLDLKDAGLKEFPQAIAGFLKLEGLSLNNNPIHQVPDWVGALPRLRNLDLGGLPISRLPEGLAEAPSLRNLGLGQISGLDWEQAADVLARIPTLKGVIFSDRMIPSMKSMLERRIPQAQLVFSPAWGKRF